MAGVGQNTNRVRIGLVIVLKSEAVIGVAGHGDQLVDDAVALLVGEFVVVSVKEGGDVIIDEQLLDGSGPVRSARVESPGGSAGIVAAPFDKGRGIGAAAPVVYGASDDVMGEDEFVFGVAVFERALEPFVLIPAERPMALRG
jgi:hypothetical protein